MFYTNLQKLFAELIAKHNLADQAVEINARILSNEEAIGNPNRDDYPLLKGKEFLMEARCMDMVGQAYTDAPSCLTTNLAQISHTALDTTEQRALFISTLNAVVRAIEPQLKTIHCHNDEPERCAEQMMNAIAILKPQKIGLVGLQPAILEALVKRWGAQAVQCLDRDNSMRGTSKYGVPILWGDSAETQAVFSASDLILATGSTIVNGSLPGLLELAEQTHTPIYFYGTSIAGAAKILHLNHLCYEAA
jgi:hypothetical protein